MNLRTVAIPSGALLAIALATTPAAAGDGDLDPRFGNGGKVIHAFPGPLDLYPVSVVDVALLDDGRFVASTSVLNGNGDLDFAVMRFHADGSVDTAFGVDGGRRVGFDRPGADLHDFASALAVQPDGRIVVAGIASGGAAVGGDDMAVLRLTASGQPDPTFGSNGRVTIAFNLGGPNLQMDHGTRIGLQSDGKLLVVGTVDTADGYSRMAVVRLHPNGQRDSSFDGDGRVVIEALDGDHGSSGVQVRQLADGAILAVGSILAPHEPGSYRRDFLLVRLLGNGTPDPGFGDDGRVRFGFDVGGSRSDYAYDFAELEDGRLLVCGYAAVNDPGNNDMACMRFLADGTPDPSFPAVLVPFDRGGAFADNAMEMAVDAQGRIVLVGTAQTTENADFAVARLLPDGSPDVRFGNGGIVTYNSCAPVCWPAEYLNQGLSLAVRPDGRLLVAGSTVNAATAGRLMFVSAVGDTLFEDGFD
jgi:uncharacterized delta-60 repeat protein